MGKVIYLKEISILFYVLINDKEFGILNVNKVIKLENMLNIMILWYNFGEILVKWYLIIRIYKFYYIKICVVYYICVITCVYLIYKKYINILSKIIYIICICIYRCSIYV